jgi:hypothetical protein
MTDLTTLRAELPKVEEYKHARDFYTNLTDGLPYTTELKWANEMKLTADAALDELAGLAKRLDDELDWMCDTLDFNLQQSGWARKELERYRQQKAATQAEGGEGKNN